MESRASILSFIHSGAQTTMAFIFSGFVIVLTCKLNGVDPQAYFADVLTRLVNLWPASRLDELMPWAWCASTPITVTQQAAA